MAPPNGPAAAGTGTAGVLPTVEQILEPSPGALMRRRIFGHAGITIGATVLIVIFVVALLAPLLSPHDPLDQDLTRRVIPPIWHEAGTWEHPLGTDQFGRDYLSRLMYGARISLLIGFVAMLISGVIGTTLGVAAGYFGGRVDMVVNFIITTRLSMPVVLVALAVVSLVGNSLWIVIWVLGLLIWDRFAVVMRDARRVDGTRPRGRSQGARLLHGPDTAYRDHAQHRQQPDRGRHHRGGPRGSAGSRTVVPGTGGAAAGSELGTHGLRGQGHDVLRPVAHRHSRSGAIRPGIVDQPFRRRIARCHRPRKPQLGDSGTVRRCMPYGVFTNL